MTPRSRRLSRVCVTGALPCAKELDNLPLARFIIAPMKRSRRTSVEWVSE